MKNGAFEISGYSYYFHAGSGKNVISKALEIKGNELLVSIPKEIIACFFDFEKSNEKDKFLGFYAVEFSGFFQTFNQRGAFLFYLISLLHMLKCTKAVLFLSEDDCVLEFPEKKNPQNTSYRQKWDMAFYHDLESFSKENGLKKITVRINLGEQEFLLSQEPDRFSIYAK